jgi:long-chain fatty acid transport protein
MRKIFFLLSGLSMSISAMAGGFQVALQGQKQIGRAHIGTPFITDASNIYFNPGALSFLEKKYSFSVGFSPIFSSAAFQNEPLQVQTHTTNAVGTPFSFYGSYKITEKLAAGIGVYTPFGSGVKWEDDWLGRYLIQSIKLRSIFIQPTVSYAITDKISLGAGFIYSTGSVAMQRALPLPVGNGTQNVELSAAAAGYGANVGVVFKPSEKYTVGLTYKSGVKMKTSGGTATFNNIPKALATSFPTDNKFEATLPLPQSVNLGAAAKISEKFTLAFEFNWVGWKAYDSLIFDFETNTDALEDSRNPRLYQNTMAIRLGTEYAYSEKFDFRAGIYYDPSPIQEEYFAPETPNCNNVGLSCGLSYRPMERLSIDVSFLQIIGLKRTASYKPSNFEGDYKTSASIPGIGVTYQF